VKNLTIFPDLTVHDNRSFEFESAEKSRILVFFCSTLRGVGQSGNRQVDIQGSVQQGEVLAVLTLSGLGNPYTAGGGTVAVVSVSPKLYVLVMRHSDCTELASASPHEKICYHDKVRIVPLLWIRNYFFRIRIPFLSEFHNANNKKGIFMAF
jgi:hypothetical protein